MRQKIEIIHHDDELALKIMSEKEWKRIAFQFRIDKIQSDGIEVIGCDCKNCVMVRFALHQIITLAMALEVNGLDYEKEVKSH